jgi:hypothetical protein
MSFIDTCKLPTIERLPGWRSRYFDSANMTFAHYDFDAGSSIHKHPHPQEEVYEVLAGMSQRLRPGMLGIVPVNASGKLIVVDCPLREIADHPR